MIDYTNDAMGQRVVKKVTTHYNPGGSENSRDVKKTIYARDANGQVMAIYNTAFSELVNTVKNDDFIRKLCFWVTFENSLGVKQTKKLCEGETFQFTDPTEEFIYLNQPVDVVFGNPTGGGVTNITLLPGTQFKLNVDVKDFKPIRLPINWADWVWNNITKRYEKAFNKNKINVYVDKTRGVVTGRKFDGTLVQIEHTEIVSEYNYDNVLTAVGENNIPELAEWHVYGSEEHGRFAVVKPKVKFQVNNDPFPNPITIPSQYSRIIGDKEYELNELMPVK